MILAEGKQKEILIYRVKILDKYILVKQAKQIIHASNKISRK